MTGWAGGGSAQTRSSGRQSAIATITPQVKKLRTIEAQMVGIPTI